MSNTVRPRFAQYRQNQASDFFKLLLRHHTGAKRCMASRLAKSALAVLALLAPGWVLAVDLPTYGVSAHAGRLSPSTLTLPAGQRIKLQLRNLGPGAVEFENPGLRVEKVLAPGATSFVVLPPLAAGHYVFVDEFHPETGRLQVTVR